MFGLFVSWCAVLVRKNTGFSHPPLMSAQQSLGTITSGHQGPAGSASKRALSLFFVPCCLLIIVCSPKTTLFSLLVLLFYLCSNLQFCLCFALLPPSPHPPCCVAVISFSRCSFLVTERVHFAIFRFFPHSPCISTFAICPIVLFFRSSRPPCSLDVLLSCLLRFHAALTCHFF